MNRISMIELGDKLYPLNFSVKAAKSSFERYGDITGVGRAVAGLDLARDAQAECMWLLSLMLQEGARYVKIVSGEDISPPAVDDLETLVGYYDTSVKETLLSAMLAGTETEIETEEEGKNAETTQSR